MSESFSVIPSEIIEAWANGQYQVGDIPSISYTQLGTALYLRSWYTYENAGKGKRLGGVAKIDIKGSFLVLAGVRLLDEDKPCAVFWTSEVSHFLGEDEILWFYLVFKADEPLTASLRALYNPVRGPVDASAVGPKRFGIADDEWDKLLEKLRTRFDGDLEQLRQKVDSASIDRGMLRFSIRPEGGVHLCTYYQFYSQTGHTPDVTLIQGTSSFRKAFKCQA